MRELFNKPVLFLSLLIFVFLISLGFFIFSKTTSKEVVCFFPDNRYEILDLEKRTIPKRRNKEEQIELYFRDLLLGPVRLELAPLFPEDTVLNLLMLREQVLYVDLSSEVMDLDEEIPMDFKEITGILKKSIFFNFKGIEQLHITIEGQIPGAPYMNLTEQ